MAQWEETLGAILNDPQAMSRIMSLAHSLGEPGQGQDADQPPAAPAEAPPPVEDAAGPASEQGSPEAAPPPELDPRLLAAGMRALAVWRDPDDPRAALLRALRPFLAQERQGKLDKAIRIVRLSRTVRAALDGLRGGVEGDV